MKRILIFLFIAGSLFAEEKVKPVDFDYTLEIAYLPLNALWQYDQPAQSKINFYAYLEGELSFYNFLFAGGGMKSFFVTKEGTKYFSPHQMNFVFFAGIRFSLFEIGFRHYCIHPIVPYMTEPVKIKWEGGYEEIYFKISSK